MRIIARAAVYDSFEDKPYQKLADAVQAEEGLVMVPFQMDGETYFVALHLGVLPEALPPTPTMSAQS